MRPGTSIDSFVPRARPAQRAPGVLDGLPSVVCSSRCSFERRCEGCLVGFVVGVIDGGIFFGGVIASERDVRRADEQECGADEHGGAASGHERVAGGGGEALSRCAGLVCCGEGGGGCAAGGGGDRGGLSS